MSSSLFAQTLLLLVEGKSVPSSTIDALRELCPDAVAAPVSSAPVAEPVATPVAAPVTAPVAAPKPAAKPKVAKLKHVVPKPAASASPAPAASPAAPAAPAAPATPAAPAPPAPPAPPAAPASASAAAATNADPWRNHPSRLKSIKPDYCVARRITEKDHVVGTGPNDPSPNGKFFIEKQCSTKLTGGASGSKLCEKCAGYEAAVKLNPKAGKGKWYGRLDEESLYPLSYVVGCSHFLSKYPNGITGDSFRPGDASPSPPSAEPTAAVAPAKTARGKKPAAKPAAVAVVETVAVDTVPKNMDWLNFMYEGRLHIRNAKTGKTYYADSQKHSLEEMAIKEHYVGRWVDGALELDDDSDDE